MAPNVDRKTHEHLFLEVISKKGFDDLCGRKFVAKSRKKTLGNSVGNSGKNPWHPQKFSRSYTCCIEKWRSWSEI